MAQKIFQLKKKFLNFGAKLLRISKQADNRLDVGYILPKLRLFKHYSKFCQPIELMKIL